MLIWRQKIVARVAANFLRLKQKKQTSVPFYKNVNTPLFYNIVNSCHVQVNSKNIFSHKPELNMSTSH
jgi:hypothetical protein